MKVLFVNADDSFRHVSSANTAIYPNLGLLTLMSSLATKMPRTELGYIDSTLYGNNAIDSIIKDNATELQVICFSVLTANYKASIELARLAKASNPKIINIFGNDHFSALSDRIMALQSAVDYGFYGNDVVTGFTEFVTDITNGNTKSLDQYAGLVYRYNSTTRTAGKVNLLQLNLTNNVCRNAELPEEYAKLPFVDYSLMNTIFDHNEKYLAGQHKVYFFMRDQSLKSQVVDIGRGCIKFAGPRIDEVPTNACDFCGIIPGQKAITQQPSRRAWDILKNAHDQGYNYFYVTADELPLTMWGMLHGMASNKPEWYMDLDEKPKMFGYARAEGFETNPEKIETLVKSLGFNHFFVGFDGLSEISLRAMNKKSFSAKHAHDKLVKQNLVALQTIVSNNCLVTAGLVVTHLGITKEIMEENFNLLREIVQAHPNTFAALDFGPLCPIPGSQSFRYLTNPEVAEYKAHELGLEVNRPFLDSIRDKYLTSDDFDMNEMVDDFIKGCCPQINHIDVVEHLSRITELADNYNIVVGGGV